MAGLLTNTFSIIGKSIQMKTGYILVPSQLEITRNIVKHWNPKWKKARKAKVIRVELPNMNPITEWTEEEKRSMMKRRGLLPARPWSEVGFCFASTPNIFEAYVPPEGDGKFSAISTAGVKQNVLAVGKKTTSMLAIRKIKNYVDDFDVNNFVEEARDTYIKAHEILISKDFEALRDYVTEKVYCEMQHNIHNKQIRWKFLESLEPARLVRARTTDIGGKENMFSQLTVRFHTKQTLAIYDRFGRLMHGSEFIAKDVLEYVVFERHIANEYGKWRIHGKIIPFWQVPRDPAISTGFKPEIPETIEKTSETSEVSRIETPEIKQ